MSTRTPRIFLGSSKEGLKVAKAVKVALEPAIEVQLWNDSFFRAGEYTLESLESRLNNFDGAVIVGTADDRITSRTVTTDAVRDNLLLEYGMAVAMFGRKRAILVLEGLDRTKIPSDLFGLTCIGFERTDPVEIGADRAATEIKRLVSSFSLDVVGHGMATAAERVLYTFLIDLQNALGVNAQVGFHVWVVDSRANPPALVRVARARSTPKAMLTKEYRQGEGIAGECWRTASSVNVDFSEEPYKSITESVWRDYGPGVRRGMDFELLEQSRNRFRVVGAYPIISDVSSGGKFLGCLTYNLGPNVDALAPAPNLLELEKVLEKASEIIRVLLESSRRPGLA